MKDINQKNRREYFKRRYQKDWSLLVSIVVLSIALTVFVFGLMRAVDLWALNTCVEFNDCEAVWQHLK